MAAAVAARRVRRFDDHTAPDDPRHIASVIHGLPARGNLPRGPVVPARLALLARHDSDAQRGIHLPAG
jgi:hypothetical protein